jgi:hypothetical protein
MPHWGKVTGEYEVIFGFSSGLLVFGGFLVWIFPGILPTILGPVLMIIGFLVLLDAAFPYGRQPHLMSESGGFVAGLIAVTASALVPGSIYWLLGTGVLFSAIKLVMMLWRKKREPKPKAFKS